MHESWRGGTRLDIAGVTLSSIAFGTMRLDRSGTVEAASRLIKAAVDMGVTTFHASQEYSTWPLFVDAWRRAAPDAAKVQLIAKVGVPHFGEEAFNPAAFTAKIDGYRSALGLDVVAVVQWLLRHDLKQEDRRRAIFDRDADLIGKTVAGLKSDRKVGTLVSFPYTAAIAGRALRADWCDGLAIYCNPLELGMIDQLDAAISCGKGAVAIRPFAAGRVFTETQMSAAEAVAFPLRHPAVATVVASISCETRLLEAAAVAAATKSDEAAWAASLLVARELTHV